MVEINLMHGDCIEKMKQIKDNTIDAVIADPPFGTTQNVWDEIIPFTEMWSELRRITKDNSPIILFSQMPFTAELVCSNLPMFRYEWIWVKAQGTGHLNAHKMPLKAHENILVFYDKLPKYNPQKSMSSPYFRKAGKSETSNYGKFNMQNSKSLDGSRFPLDVIKFNQVRCNSETSYHPTQKPLDLIQYLINTYTDIGDTVLDFCMGGVQQE